ncbi:MAG TPA: hypothetical protein VFI25_19045 [Planctomycetota bacterium]|jgi:hypothetical protein|nr:hypothetical protein [Planctomycetota bacterium]
MLLAAAALLLLRSGPGVVEDLAALAPPDALVFAEVREPGAIYARFRGSPLERALRGSPAWREFAESPKGRNLEKTLAAWKGISGLPLDESLRRIASRGLAAAILPVPASPKPDLLLLARAADEDSEFAAQTLQGLANLVTLGRKGEGVRREEIGEAVLYGIDGKLFAGSSGSLTIVSTNESVLKAALARAAGATSASLAGAAPFRAARESLPSGAALFAFLDAARAAATRPEGKLLPLEPSAGAAFLFGAVRELVNASPFLGLAVSGSGRSIRAILHAPVPPDGLAPEVRSIFFPSKGAPPVARAVAPAGEFLALRLYRDFEAFWTAREALGPFDDAGLRMGSRVLFGGRRFEQDILPHLGPELDLFLCRQTFGGLPRPPQVRLPGGVIVGRLRNPDALRSALTMAFQTGVGLANAQRGQEGKEGLLLSSEKHGEATFHVARYVPPEGDGPLPIEFNATPACAVVGDRFYLSSSVESLASAIDAGLAPARPGDRLDLDAAGLRALLEENEAPIVASRVLRGKTRERALSELRLFLDLLARVEGASLTFGGDGTGATLEAVLRFLY